MKLSPTENAAVDGALVEIWGQRDLENITNNVPMKNETASHFLDDLYRCGALQRTPNPFAPIDPYELILEGRESVDPRAIRALDGMFITKRREPQVDFDMLASTPEVMEYVENAYTSVVANFNYLPYELARFVVPNNRIGIVRTMETDLTWDDPLITWPRGDAIFHERQGVDVRWKLRIEHLDPRNPVDPYTYRSPLIPPNVVIPGTPYGNLPEWREMRFMWGEFNPVYFILPPNTLLSLWIVFANGSCNLPLRSVSGRFTGFLQTQESWRTYHNVTTVW